MFTSTIRKEVTRGRSPHTRPPPMHPGGSLMWFKVDDNLAFHRKVVAAGNAAMGLWVRSGSWCAQHLTDGFIPDEMVGILGTASQRSKLITVGLWIEVAGGCRFHEWNENGRQPTGQSVREKRAAAAERQAKHRDQLYENRQVRASRNGVTDTSVTTHVTPLLTPTPTRPDPSTSADAEVHPLPGAPRSATVGTQLSVIPGGQIAKAARPVNGGEMVKVWYDEYVRTHDGRPSNQACKRVGKDARALLEAGNDPSRVRAACLAAAGRGRYAVEQEFLSMDAREGATQDRRPSATTRAVVEAQSLKDMFPPEETA